MHRLLAACAALSILAACAGVPLPTAEPAAPVQLAALGPVARAVEPRLTQDRFVTVDGAELPLRAWIPDGKPRAVVLALHGFNDYSNAFLVPALHWAKAGIATYAYDQRGFGQAPQRGLWAGPKALAGDAIVAATLLRRRYPDVPLYLMGESMGGAVSILAMTSAAPPPVDGVVLVAPAVWGRQTMNIFQRAGLWFASLMPALQVSGRDLPVKVRPSDNIAMLRAYGADPLVIKDTRAEAVTGLVDMMGAALDAAPRLKVPTLVLYGENDEIVPRRPVARMVATLPAEAQPRQRVALYQNGWHMLFRDLDGATVTKDVAAWMLDRDATLPSGADRNARAALVGARPVIAVGAPPTVAAAAR